MRGRPHLSRVAAKVNVNKELLKIVSTDSLDLWKRYVQELPSIHKGGALQ